MRQRTSTVHLRPNGMHELIAKGSPESILPLCKAIRIEPATSPLDPDEEGRVLADVETLAAQGLRILAFARHDIAGEVSAIAREAEVEMEFLGLIGMADPVRPEVPLAVRTASRAGIKVLMLTGDHPSTAITVARDAGLEADTVVLGSDLPTDTQVLGELLATKAPVLARLAPEQKLEIARAPSGRRGRRHDRRWRE